MRRRVRTGIISVHAPDWARQYIGKLETTPAGASLYRFRYGIGGVWCWPDQLRRSVDPQMVAAVIREKQSKLPLGGIGDFDIICSDLTLFAGDHPTAGLADAKTMPGSIILAAAPGANIADLDGHELSHALAIALIDSLETAELRPILGSAYGTTEDAEWRDRPSERLAEYLSAAVWGDPIDPRMPQLDAATLERVREWAIRAIGPAEPARIEVDGMATVITLQIGNPVMTVDGAPVTLDVAPFKVDPPGRTMVPLRAISEAFGATVGWDEATQTVTITKG